MRYWPAPREHRKVLLAVLKEEGLFHQLEFSASLFEDIRTQDYDEKHVLEMCIKYLTARPEWRFRRIACLLAILSESVNN